MGIPYAYRAPYTYGTVELYFEALGAIALLLVYLLSGCLSEDHTLVILSLYALPVRHWRV